MKKIWIIWMAVIALLAFAGCEERVLSGETGSKPSEHSSALADISAEPDSAPEPMKKMKDQPDPTLPENMQASFYS